MRARSAESSASKTSEESNGRGTQSTVISRRVFSPRGAWVLAACTAITLFLADQGTKYLVVTNMQVGERITVIDGLLWWYSIRNPGAAFSFGQDATWIFTLLMVAAALTVLYLLNRTRALGWILALGGLLGGVLGNLFDRLFRDPGFGLGHVVDFISVPNFAIFNIADSAICVSMACIVLLNLRGMTLVGEAAVETKKNPQQVRDSKGNRGR